MEKTLSFLGKFCIHNCETIAVAESVTSGCIQTLLSNIVNAKDFFQGGITVYNNAQKAKHLQIDPIFADHCDAVDQEIAIEMARSISKSFCSKIGISSTGYAAPMPEKGIEKPFTYCAIVRKDNVLYAERMIAASSSYGFDVQMEYSNRILKTLEQLIRNGVLK